MELRKPAVQPARAETTPAHPSRARSLSVVAIAPLELDAPAATGTPRGWDSIFVRMLGGLLVVAVPFFTAQALARQYTVDAVEKRGRRWSNGCR